MNVKQSKTNIVIIVIALSPGSAERTVPTRATKTRETRGVRGWSQGGDSQLPETVLPDQMRGKCYIGVSVIII